MKSLEKHQKNSEIGQFPDKGEFLNVLGKDAYVMHRIYNLRHGKTHKGGHTGDKEGLLEGEVERIVNNQGKRLLEYGVNQGNVSINFAGRTTRIRETADAIIRALNISQINIQNNVSELDTIPRNLKNQTEGNSHLITLADKGNKYLLELYDVLAQKPEGHNIINIIHKTNLSGMNAVVNRSSGENIQLDIYGAIEENEIKEIDVSAENQGINYNKSKDILFLGDHNVDEIIEILAEDELFGDVIAQYKSRKIQIYQVQNYLNYMFKKSPHICGRYAAIRQKHLSIFSIANLVKHGDMIAALEGVDGYIQNGGPQLFRRVDELLQISIPGWKSMLVEKLLKDYENQTSSILNHQLEDDKFRYLLYYSKEVHKDIQNMRKKTLDDKLKNGEDVIIPLGFTSNQFQSVDELLNAKQAIWIEGAAGAGKSVKMLAILEYLKPQEGKDPSFVPIYINLGESRYQQLSEISRAIASKQDILSISKTHKFVYLLDALDEAHYDENHQQEFMKIVKSLQATGGQVIVTARPNTLSLDQKKHFQEMKSDPMDVSTNKINKLQLQKLSPEQIEQYLLDHVSPDKLDVRVSRQNKQFIHDIKDNPLMLSILANLLLKRAKGEIEHIKAKGVLYDLVVTDRLSTREEMKNKSKISKRRLEVRKRLVAEIAYRSFVEDLALAEENIQALIAKNDDYALALDGDDMNYDLDCLNLLFRKNEDGLYAFVHESFREYLMAKHVTTTYSPEAYIQELSKYSPNDQLKYIDNICAFLNRFVVQMVKVGYDITIEHRNKENLLHISAKNGNRTLTKFLLAAGIDVNSRNIHGETPLMLSAQSGFHQTASILVDGGADIDAMSNTGKYPLMKAIENSRETVARVLLEKGASLNPAKISIIHNGRHLDTSINTELLLHAVKIGAIALVKLLLDYGADISYTNTHGESAMYLAFKNGNFKIAGLLVEYGFPLEKDLEVAWWREETLMARAVARCYHEAIEFLLNNGCKIDEQSRGISIKYGNWETIKYLLEKGAEMNQLIWGKYSALMIAIANGHVDVAELLLLHGASINLRSGKCGNALTVAVEYSKLEIVPLLVEKGADLNVPNDEGMTPLLYAIKSGDILWTKYFLENGASPNRMMGGLSLIRIANDFGHQNIAQLLTQYGAKE